jgi:hypothetical protein
MLAHMMDSQLGLGVSGHLQVYLFSLIPILTLGPRAMFNPGLWLREYSRIASYSLAVTLLLRGVMGNRYAMGLSKEADCSLLSAEAGRYLFQNLRC